MSLSLHSPVHKNTGDGGEPKIVNPSYTPVNILSQHLRSSLVLGTVFWVGDAETCRPLGDLELGEGMGLF